jgi:hypothetical protein
MRLGHSDDMQWVSWPGIRGENAVTQILLQQHVGRPDDYELQIAKWAKAGNHSPRHKHVFDQFRFTLRGDIQFGPDQYIPEGCLGYFPEGTPYGPFGNDEKPVMLSLQFGGPNGNGHIQRDDLRAAQHHLAREGSFENGIYTYFDAEGRKHNVDAHKAVWERASGHELVFSEPRYAEPVLVYPNNYHWRELGNSVSEKLLGMFNERGTYAKMLRLGAGAVHERGPGTQATLGFIVDGEIAVAGEICHRHDAFHLAPEDKVRLEARTDTIVLIYGLPDFP